MILEFRRLVRNGIRIVVGPMQMSTEFTQIGAARTDAHAGTGAKPFWSVALPTYNVDADLFERTVRSVLDQDPGPTEMEIFVSDNQSTNGIAERVIERLAPDRVAIFRNARNLGLAGNWNACVSRARGEWVHILHADDIVLPGFYERLEVGAAASSEVGVLLCQHAFIDEHDRWTSISQLERHEPGVLEGWLEKIATGQRVQCPAVVVRREVYDLVGRFRDDLLFVVDWEMWVRIASAGVKWWYEPTVLAGYRIHTKTTRLRRSGQTTNDLDRGIRAIQSYVPARLRERVGEALRKSAGDTCLRDADEAIRRGSLREAMGLLNEACRLRPALRFASPFLLYSRWIVLEAIRRVWRRHPPTVQSGRPETEQPAHLETASHTR
jgi:glycosyltransferase involved in cell wall biosynthesis